MLSKSGIDDDVRDVLLKGFERFCQRKREEQKQNQKNLNRELNIKQTKLAHSDKVQREVVRLESSPVDAERVLRMDREHETTISSTRNREKVSLDSLNLPPTPQDSPMQKVDTAGALGQQKGRPKTGSNGRPDDVPGDSRVNSYALESPALPLSYWVMFCL